MNDRQSEFVLPPEIDEQLDQLLARWAKCYQITPAQAKTIRQTIVETSAGLGYEWWRNFLDHVTTSVSRSVSTGLQQAATGWPLGLFKDTPDYQPYLRLA